MAHITLRNLVASRPDKNFRKRRGRTARPVRPSRKDELWYKASLRALVGQLKTATDSKLLPFLKSRELSYSKDHAASMRRAQDSGEYHAAPFARDASFDDELDALLDSIFRSFGGIDDLADRLATEAGRRALYNTDKNLASSLKSSLGVDIGPALTMAPDVQMALDFHTRANIDLIKSIPDQYFDKIAETVRDNVQAGLRFEDIADSIAHIGGVTDSRANLIARDQTSKMNGAFNEIRQTDLGIEGYIWQGAEDERERETHLANEGLFFRWDDPPDTGHPGADIQCRCVALPYFDLDDTTDTPDDSGDSSA